MQDHWLARQGTVKPLWIVFGALLAATVAADFWVEHRPYFALDGTFGFGAWFGFASCVGLIVIAKALGALLKRPDTYYD